MNSTIDRRVVQPGESGPELRLASLGLQFLAQTAPSAGGQMGNTFPENCTSLRDSRGSSGNFNEINNLQIRGSLKTGKRNAHLVTSCSHVDRC
jgi:hypothetical protein